MFKTCKACNVTAAKKKLINTLVYLLTSKKISAKLVLKDNCSFFAVSSTDRAATTAFLERIGFTFIGNMAIKGNVEIYVDRFPTNGVNYYAVVTAPGEKGVRTCSERAKGRILALRRAIDVKLARRDNTATYESSESDVSIALNKIKSKFSHLDFMGGGNVYRYFDDHDMYKVVYENFPSRDLPNVTLAKLTITYEYYD